MLRRLLALSACATTLAGLTAAPPAPAEPEAYNVVIRYQIRAFRNERIRQYREMTAAFKAAGFARDPDEDPGDEAENPRANLMRGTLPARGVRRLLGQRHVGALLLWPEKSKLPEKGTRVRVDLMLASGY